MSLVYKRPDSPVWYVTKTRTSTRTTSRKLAEEFARKQLQALWRDEVLDDRVRTWRDLTAAWEDRKAESKRSFDQDARVIRRTTEFLRARDMLDSPLGELSSDVFLEYARQVKAGASGATANRHLTIIGSMFKTAARLGWVARVPHLEHYQEERGAPRWLTRDEFATFCRHLPEWVQDMAVVAVQTGMRYSNVAGLRWSWLSDDLTICRVPATRTKTGRMYTVPVSSVARVILEKIKKSRESTPADGSIAPHSENQDLVFQNPDRPGELVTSVRFWWDRACIKSGIDCRFHDLRHTWASWHIQANTPDRVIQESAGWSSPAMLQRYAHLSVKHLTDYADNLNSVTK